MKNRVFVITGAAGSGKTTVRDYLHNQYKMARVITHTTRAPRANERDGIDYYFEDNESFFDNHFLESVHYAGNYYGSSYEGLENAWEKSPLATIVLDTAGAITYKQKLGDKAIIIFLEVGDSEELQRRMQGRGDNAEMVEKRIKSQEYNRDLQMPYELKGKAYEVVNKDWDKTRKRLTKSLRNIMINGSLVVDGLKLW